MATKVANGLRPGGETSPTPTWMTGLPTPPASITVQEKTPSQLRKLLGVLHLLLNGSLRRRLHSSNLDTPRSNFAFWYCTWREGEYSDSFS